MCGRDSGESMVRPLRVVGLATHRIESPVKSKKLESTKHGTISFHRTRLLGGLALIGSSAVLGYLMLGQDASSINHYVMVRNLAAGALITPEDVEIRSLPASVPHPYISVDEDIFGQRLARDAFVGEFIPLNGVLKPGEPNLRTVSIPIGTGHAPVVSAGELVDVWMTPSVDGVMAPGPAELVLEAAVIETGNVDQDTSIDSVVTVTVLFDDVQKIVGAIQSGSISLVQVHGNERGKSDVNE